MSRKDKILNGNALYTFIAIIIGFVAGAVLLAVAGINPGLAYGKLLNGVFGQVKYITWSIVYAAPLILTGLSVAFSFRTGVFNIGQNPTNMYFLPLQTAWTRNFSGNWTMPPGKKAWRG